MELSRKKRRMILMLRFKHLLPYYVIATDVGSITEDGVRKLYIRTRERAGSDNIDILLKHARSKARSRRPSRILPRLLTAIRIREALRGADK